MLKRLKLKSGFSLVEMLVVVAIIGVLSTVLYTSYTKYVEKSQRSVITKEASDVMNVFEVAFIEHQANGRLENATIDITNYYNFNEMKRLNLKNAYAQASGKTLPSEVYLQYDDDETHIMYEHNGYVAYYSIEDKKVDNVEKWY